MQLRWDGRACIISHSYRSPFPTNAPHLPYVSPHLNHLPSLQFAENTPNPKCFAKSSPKNFREIDYL